MFIIIKVVLDSSAVEHSAVNRRVVGSNPTRGVLKSVSQLLADFNFEKINIWLRGQAVKTSPFHGGNTGSIPVGVIIFFEYADVAQFHKIDYVNRRQSAGYKSAAWCSR